ncbi:unnamed protein product [Amoebophrya sp. A120]|nr:unnamed protein product [Amoebophrya sp. A120]|eukprot:GSA120T00002528001.1
MVNITPQLVQLAVYAIILIVLGIISLVRCLAQKKRERENAYVDHQAYGGGVNYGAPGGFPTGYGHGGSPQYPNYGQQPPPMGAPNYGQQPNYGSFGPNQQVLSSGSATPIPIPPGPANPPQQNPMGEGVKVFALDSTAADHEASWRGYEAERIGCPSQSLQIAPNMVEELQILEEMGTDPQLKIVREYIDPEDVCGTRRSCTRYALNPRKFYEERLAKYPAEVGQGGQITVEQLMHSPTGKYQLMHNVDDAPTDAPFLHPAQVLWHRSRRTDNFRTYPTWDIAYNEDGSVDYENCKLMELQDVQVAAIRVAAKEHPEKCEKWLRALADLESRQSSNGFSEEWRQRLGAKFQRDMQFCMALDPTGAVWNAAKPYNVFTSQAKGPETGLA